ncbi:MAG: hypothetical protein CFE40_01200 [Burkholderiales bacterium PBB1]|nr:MAG: hypothetical protein CFE40_01200 [Burkholderiales bacterium PBB1]
MDQTVRTKANPGYLVACVAAIASLLIIRQVDPDAAAGLLHGSMLSVHALLELVAIIVASLVVMISWHTFDLDKEQPANVLLYGFLVVAVCDLLHTLSYKGMPKFIQEGDQEIAIFFWLMGRTFEAGTLLLIALGKVPRIRRMAALCAGIATSAVLCVVGNFYIHELPDTFIEGVGVTPLKAYYEYGLCAANLAIAALLARKAQAEGSEQCRMLALSCFMMAVGGLSFTSYVSTSDFQNIFGHVYKVIAYALLYRATFISSIRAPFEAVRRSEAKVVEYSAQLKSIGNNLPQSVLFQVAGRNPNERNFIYVSDAAERVLGPSSAEIVNDAGEFYSRIHPEDQRGFKEAQRRSQEYVTEFETTVRFQRPDGTLRHINLHSAPRQAGGGLMVWDGIITDVTERIAAEEARRRVESSMNESQRLEALGTLASGIAHDFNNILGSIIGNVSLLTESIKRGATADAQRGVQQIHKASVRARDLVKQILTFSRKQAIGREVVELREVVTDSLGLIGAARLANVSLHTELEDAYARANATQIQQIVLNLCTNAAQAMGPDGGRIDVGLKAVDVSDERASELGLTPGRYANLWVADDGCGMDEETQRRVFEPFFTTKPVGSGTGLGMSVVHSIVATHEGAIALASAPGKGTRFDIYLPLESAPAPTLPEAAAPINAPRTGGERVMYVDDDELMAMMIEDLLTEEGYKVTSFPDAGLAIDVMRENPDAFDIVVTDYNMPTHSGLDVIQAMREIRPDLPTLLSTGYVTEEMSAKAKSLGVSEILEKEHSSETLPGAIRRAMAASVVA